MKLTIKLLLLVLAVVLIYLMWRIGKIIIEKSDRSAQAGGTH